MANRAKNRKRPSPQREPAAACGRGRFVSQRRRWVAVIVVVGIAVAIVAVLNNSPENDPVPVYGYEVVNSYPHDSDAYTQGLAFADGQLFEGTGQYGFSSVRRVDLETGKVLDQVDLDEDYFGEGITVWKDRIIQLTWESETGIVYDKSTLKELHRFSYEGEGWGLTHDGRNLIMSDGTATLRFLDPDSYKVVRQLVVRRSGSEESKLNELEYVQGEIWANVWHKDYIVRIDPNSGEVKGRINLTGLYPRSRRLDAEAVLNGIAYDAEGDRVLVTGKNWPKLFEIRVSSEPTPP